MTPPPRRPVGPRLSAKPIVGIAGGIGGGKTFVARLFADLGCAVITADDQVRAAYADPAVRATLRQWWGDAAFDPDGTVRRTAVADRIFTAAQDRLRLERLLHAWVAADRDRAMAAVEADPAVAAFVWDTPLLFEVGLDRRCDAVVFVDVPEADRVARVTRQRGWAAGELTRRQNLQMPLDKKREMSDYVVVGTADAAAIRDQIQTVLSRLIEARPVVPGDSRGKHRL